MEKEKGGVPLVEVSPVEHSPRDNYKEEEPPTVSFWCLFRWEGVSQAGSTAAICCCSRKGGGQQAVLSTQTCNCCCNLLICTCSHATAFDWLLMALGTCGALANGEWGQCCTHCSARLVG